MQLVGFAIHQIGDMKSRLSIASLAFHRITNSLNSIKVGQLKQIALATPNLRRNYHVKSNTKASRKDEYSSSNAINPVFRGATGILALPLGVSR